jgi:exopolysaccharide production protein ExoZ
MQKLNSIQVLRAIAALAVLFCHVFAIEEGQSGRTSKLTDFWVAGVHGVDLFFVISGFVIVWVGGRVRPGPLGAADFLYARATRIYPLWWLFAGLMMLFLILTLGLPWDPVRLDRQGLDGPTHLVKSILLWPQGDHPELGVGWTLVHEMYFYIGFSVLILALPVRYRLPGLLAWASAVLLGALSGLSANHAGTVVELLFFPMTLQFIQAGSSPMLSELDGADMPICARSWARLGSFSRS